jgi:anti-sigma regulatory factor (Ser/Thr protein kinase)
MLEEPLHEVTTFAVESRPGNERQAMRQVADATAPLGLPPRTCERLQTAVAETVLNAMEHGHGYDATRLVYVRVLANGRQVTVSVSDGGERPMPSHPVEPDLVAKLAGEQPTRGWGLFLIRHMVDEMVVEADKHHHTVLLVVHRMPAVLDLD